ncbi:MAG: DNA replication protein DnaC [Firmicutes bacterium HGW-Firmicutes-16]|nr:MAG: DNA replication protein DnaC [Firmicutes bacterium HGW-Firmicutes-16]
MAYDGKILARAKDIIAGRKRANEDERTHRRAEVFSRIPAVIETEKEITTLMTEVAFEALKKGSDAGIAVEAARTRCDLLLKRHAELLKSGGYPADYIDEIYDCPVCHDTGYSMGKPCTCLKSLYKTEAVKELSSILDTAGQCFEKFDLGYYDDVRIPELKYSPRALMTTALTICSEYASKFGQDSVNLLFRGGTGLGKTFLSASIAKVVSEKGFSVVYDTSISVMEAFELQKFDRSGDGAEETAARVKRYTDCDLLILDDLGTEMTTNFTQSALYSLVNGRLLRSGKTIITTNLSEDELHRRYSPQIVSRLEGEYLVLNFAGRDIRAIKREGGLK